MAFLGVLAIGMAILIILTAISTIGLILSAIGVILLILYRKRGKVNRKLFIASVILLILGIPMALTFPVYIIIGIIGA